MSPFTLNPVTRERLRTFRSMKRAWISFCLLAGLYALSLFSNLLANDRPLVVRHEGDWLFPMIQFVPEDRFLSNGRNTRPDYKELDQREPFQADDNWMIWPLIPYGFNEGIRADRIPASTEIEVRLSPSSQTAQVDLGPDGQVLRSRNTGWLEWGARGDHLDEVLELPPDVKAAMERRFANEPAPPISTSWTPITQPVQLEMSAFEPRTARPPRFLRLLLREPPSERDAIQFTTEVTDLSLPDTVATKLTPLHQDMLISVLESFASNSVARDSGEVGDWIYALEKEIVTFPFRPVEGHPFGLDSSGRDVGVRLLYATRISLNFGFLLVGFTMLVGIGMGAIQGYFGGWVDLTGQRLIEIWESLPFLYILMLMGSVFGRSFLLLLICYGIFNWIGISYYMRAEFLRLRHLPFVDAARVTGLPAWKIMARHILPNSLVPIITFFPFSLVGAIGMLAAVDFLGFGLPPPVPSYGELLSQAMEFQFAWWLITFPALALFVIILLGVFIGEGIQEAFNPRKETRWDG